MFGGKSKNVGVIGLGIIGSRVEENLRRADFNVFVWNRTTRAVPGFLASPLEVAEVTQVIQIFVRDAEALRDAIVACGCRSVRYVEDSDGDHSEASWARRLPDALRWLYQEPEEDGAS